MSNPWDYIAKLVCIGDSGCGKSSLTIRLCEGRFSPTHDVTIGVEFGSRIVPVGPPHSKPEALPSLPDDGQDDGGDEHASDSSNGNQNNPAAATSSSSSKPSSKPQSTTGETAKTKQDHPSSGGGLPSPPKKPKPEPPAGPQKHMKLSLWDTAGQETYKSVTRSYFRGASGALLVFDLSRRQTFQHVTDWLNDLRQIAEPDIVVILVGNKADLATSSSSSSADGDGGDEGKDSGNKRQVTTAEAAAWARRNGVLEYVETSAKSGENVERAFMRVAERIYQNIQAGKYDLNDRRSGVKGPGAGARGNQVKLAGDPVKGSGGGCC